MPNTFVYVKYWYVLNEKVDSYFFNIKKKIAALYDTFALFKDYSLPEDTKKPDTESYI